eukprot:14089469-Heterocapsa_arctica.AAC.1
MGPRQRHPVLQQRRLLSVTPQEPGPDQTWDLYVVFCHRDKHGDVSQAQFLKTVWSWIAAAIGH